MDPLSVTTSVVGLLEAAEKIAFVLSRIKFCVVEAPKSLDQLLSQIKDLQISLSAVSKFIDGINSASRQRMSMIKVDELIATLTEAVLTFSELEALIAPLGVGSDISLLDRLDLAWKEEKISSILLRLDRHKTTIILMLTVVQCESNIEAERAQQRLHIIYQQLLDSNQDVSERLRNLEDRFETESVRTVCVRNSNYNVANDSNISLPPIVTEDTKETCFHAFEADLGISKVYTRTQPYESDVSFTTSAVRSHAWSVLSGLSLSQVSSISIIGLPVYANDLFNNQWYSPVPSEGSGHDDGSATMHSEQLASPLSDHGMENHRTILRVSISSFGHSLSKMYEIVVFGNKDAETFLTWKFVGSRRGDYRQHVATKHAIIDGQPCRLCALGYSLLYEYPVLSESWVGRGHEFVILYSPIRRLSSTLIMKLYTSIRRFKHDPRWIPEDFSEKDVAALLGTHHDEASKHDISTHKEQALIGGPNSGFVDISATRHVNVEDGFTEVVRQIRQRENTTNITSIPWPGSRVLLGRVEGV